MIRGENICITNEAETGEKIVYMRPRRRYGILNIQVELILYFLRFKFKPSLIKQTVIVL